MGMIAAGAQVVGWDIEQQPDYPGEFHQGDALALSVEYLREFDLVWSSPPCQAYSRSTPDKSRHPKLIEKTRDLLVQSGVPAVIENVPSAPLRRDLFLCGEMFHLRVVRHRIFELHGFVARQPAHPPHQGACLQEFLKGNADSWYYYSPHGNALKWRECGAAMGVGHIGSCAGMVEAIPPAYACYIVGEYLRGQKQVEFDFEDCAHVNRT